MILCRIFIGFSDQSHQDAGDIVGIFEKQGLHQTLYVIDELAIMGFGKHAEDLVNRPLSDGAVKSEFRESQNYSVDNFIDKVVRPIIIQEHFGVRTTFSFEREEVKYKDSNRVAYTQLTNTGKVALEEFAAAWVVGVNVPDGARSIPTGSTGVLVPKPYKGSAPSVTVITTSIDGLDIDAESA